MGKLPKIEEKLYTQSEVVDLLVKSMYKSVRKQLKKQDKRTKDEENTQKVVNDILDPNFVAEVDPDELPVQRDKVLYKSPKSKDKGVAKLKDFSNKRRKQSDSGHSGRRAEENYELEQGDRRSGQYDRRKGDSDLKKEDRQGERRKNPEKREKSTRQVDGWKPRHLSPRRKNQDRRVDKPLDKGDLVDIKSKKTINSKPDRREPLHSERRRGTEKRDDPEDINNLGARKGDRRKTGISKDFERSKAAFRQNRNRFK